MSNTLSRRVAPLANVFWGQTTEKAKQFKQKQKINSNNNRSNTAQTEKAATTFWKVRKRAKIGFSTVGDLEVPAAAVRTEASCTNSSKKHHVAAKTAQTKSKAAQTTGEATQKVARVGWFSDSGPKRQKQQQRQK